MKTINSTLSGAYYQFPNSSPSLVAGRTAAVAPINNAAQTSSAGSDSAFLLDLSPSDRQFLSNAEAANNTPDLLGEFILTAQQRKAIDEILAQYKDSPQDQDHFNKIQDDLRAVNLAPEQLALVDKSRSLGTTQILLNNFDGKYSDPITLSQAADRAEKAKSDKYIEFIVSRWKGLSAQAVTPAQAA